MFPVIRGIPGWAAVLLIVAFVALSYAIDWNKPLLGRPLTILYFAGCVLAVLLVRRRGLFWPAVMPPIIGALGVPLFYLLTATPLGETLGRADVLTALVPLAKRFPLILVTWLIVLAIAVVRGFVLEPSTTRGDHHLAEKVLGRMGFSGTRGSRGSSRRPAPRRSAAAASRAAGHRNKHHRAADRTPSDSAATTATDSAGGPVDRGSSSSRRSQRDSAAAAARSGDRPLPPIRRTTPKAEPQPEAAADKHAQTGRAKPAAGGRTTAAAQSSAAAPRAGSRRLGGKEPHSERGRRIRRED